MKFGVNERRALVDDIYGLSKDEHIEIFKILRESTNKYTKNDNGIFINITVLSDSVLERIYRFVSFCKDNKKNLEMNEEIIETEKNRILSSSNKEESEELEVKNIDDSNSGENNKSSQSDVSFVEEDIKISLKRVKPKYTGVKAKIMKNYNRQSTNIQKVIYKSANPSENNIEENTYNIDEEKYDDLEEDIEEYVEEDEEEDEEEEDEEYEDKE